MFPCLRTQETFVAETIFVSKKCKIIVASFQNNLHPYMHSRWRAKKTVLENIVFDVSATIPSVCGALTKSTGY